MTRCFRSSLLVGAMLLAVSCGYHVGGQADTMPKAVHTIAIPPFANSTMRYTLTDELPREIGREFTSRTRFVIINNPAEADAVLNGTVVSALTLPTIYDPGSGKATSVQVVVNLTVRLLEQRTGKVLYSRSNWGIREDYELAVDPHQFFDERGPAFDRLCRDVARDLVSAIVEDF